MNLLIWVVSDIEAVCWRHCSGSDMQQAALSAGTWQPRVHLRWSTWTA